MESLEYIDDYFNGRKLPDETVQFEKRIAADPSFAEAVAFYLNAREAVKQQLLQDKKERFRELYNQNEQDKKGGFRKITWAFMAAAAGIILLLGIWYFFVQPTSPQTLANSYIKEKLTTLGVKMSGTQDSVQEALRLYNDEKYAEALKLFETVSNNNPNDFAVKKYAGIVSLQLNEYDKALAYFTQLEQHQGMFANPGKFYHALTLMKRGLPQDKALEKQLLQEVISQDLEGKETAAQWIKQL